MSAIKSGRTPPSLDVVSAVCLRYAVDANWLIFGFGNMYIGTNSDMKNEASEFQQTEFDFHGKITDDVIVKLRRIVSAPGLFQLFETQTARDRLNISADELTIMATAVKTNPGLYRHAPPATFLEMLHSYRMDKLDGVESLLETLLNKKG
jgi:hypothetical protein